MYDCTKVQPTVASGYLALRGDTAREWLTGDKLSPTFLDGERVGSSGPLPPSPLPQTSFSGQT